ncbi:MAG: hypothetical protein AABW73_02225 [Nanoarchaeota archaeon]
MKNNNLLMVFGILLLLAVSLVSAQSDNYRYGMMGSNGQFYQVDNANGGYGYGMGGMMQAMWGYGNYGGGFIFLSWITYLLIIALIVAAIYWLIKNANKRK